MSLACPDGGGTPTGPKPGSGRGEVPCRGWFYAETCADPSLRHKNCAAEFGGPSYRVALVDEERDSLALEAVHQFIEEQGQVPTSTRGRPRA